MKARVFKIIPIIVLSLLLTGCWDNIEIDKKAFVSTIAIDVGSDVLKREDIKHIKPSEVYYPDNLNMVQVTYGFPDIRTMESGRATAPDVAITVDGYSMTDAYSKAILQSSRTLHFGHSKLLLLSDEIFQHRELAREVMDYIEREPSLNRTIVVAIVNGKAKDYVKMNPLMEENIDTYILGIMGNSTKNGSIYPVTLNSYIDTSKSGGINMLPVFSFKSENELNLEGVGIIEDNEITEYLNERQITDIQILKGDIGSCKKVIYKDGHPIDYYIRGVTRKVDVDYKEEALYLNYRVSTEGSLKGYFTEANLLDIELVQSIQQHFDDTMAAELLSIANIAKNEMNLDLIEAEKHIKKYHPKIWKQVKHNWPQAYYNANISVSVENNIRTVGLTN